MSTSAEQAWPIHKRQKQYICKSSGIRTGIQNLFMVATKKPISKKETRQSKFREENKQDRSIATGFNYKYFISRKKQNLIEPIQAFH
ncbi:hypothetical protein CCACVL1_05489 [Corchorus capsularis]|uniref:Uncharacterized protein n=1 Tax=Corchorus capsularis TaxID=210143 RepID=A0A1R3JK43_COCAP|nr:hypothetical protein CCACVL1_05489 [Corchorus capsularis]